MANVLKNEAGSLGAIARPGVTGNNEIEVCQGAARTCDRCGLRLVTRDKRAKYCSRECSHPGVPKAMCQQCGVMFKGRERLYMTFCGRACSDKHNHEQGRYRRAFAGHFVQVGRLYTCRICGRVSEHGDTWKMACSRECQLSLGRQRHHETWVSARETNPTVSKACNECGETFDTNYFAATRVFCSQRCGEKQSKRMCASRRRARKHRAFVEDVDILYLMDRDDGKCQMCGCKVVPYVRGAVKTNARTVDHIVPLSQGGEHSKRNAQLLCLMCNSTKETTGGAQLLLIG